MKRETIEKILNFLKEKEGKELPKEWFDSEKKYKLIQKLENHPDGIQYKHRGSLNLINSNITKLPNDLHVEFSLYLNNTKITKLPDNLYVGNNLSLSGCQQLTELPNNLYVEDDLILHNSNITEIPNNLYVGQNLWLHTALLADKYTDEQIRDIVTSTGGKIINDIIRL